MTAETAGFGPITANNARQTSRRATADTYRQTTCCQLHPVGKLTLMLFPDMVRAGYGYGGGVRSRLPLGPGRRAGCVRRRCRCAARSTSSIAAAGRRRGRRM